MSEAVHRATPPRRERGPSGPVRSIESGQA